MILSQVSDWPPALGLLVAVLADDPQCSAQLSQTMTERDWHVFTDLAIDRHRVAPLITSHLQHLDPPQAVADTLTDCAQRNAMQVLHQVATLREINECFAAREIRFAVLKGWPLSEDLFGSNNARQTKDIDLLVAPDMTMPAAEALLSMGFEPSTDHPERFRLLGSSSLQEEFNNVSLQAKSTGLCVELHWRCHQFSGWPELFTNGSNLSTQQTPIGALTVPDPRNNLIYLAIHGSMHRWSRLKWLCDIAKLAKRRGITLLAEDVEYARANGAGRPLELALFLAGGLLGSPCPETRYRPQSWLVRQCLREIDRSDAVPAGLAHRMKFYAMMLALSDGFAQRTGIVRYRLWGKHRLALAAMRHSG